MHVGKSMLVIAAAVAVGILLPVTSMFFASEAAAESQRERRQRIELREREKRKTPVDKRRNRESDDSVRANALDPSGNYKGYPDWARAALSPKDNEGG